MGRVGTIKDLFNPPFPVLKAGHSVSYSYICDVCSGLMEWVSFYILSKIPVWLVCYAHVFHAHNYSYILYVLSYIIFLSAQEAAVCHGHLATG